jgi:penicillin G amidase
MLHNVGGCSTDSSARWVNQIVSLQPGRVRGENVVAPGESGDVRSPHFADQLQLYATWTYKPMRLSPRDLAGHVTQTITL